MRHAAGVLLVLTLSLSVAAVAAAPQFDPAALDREAETALGTDSIPGAAVAVVDEGRVVYAKGFGTTSVDDGAPVTAHTLFRLGSTTKTVVALAVMRLAADGRVRLDAPISTYARGLHPRLGALTLQQLLTHTAGLSDDAAMIGPPNDDALGARVRAFDDRAFFTTAGDVMSYANPGYAVIGDVIEEVTHRSFADAMTDLVLAPLGMSSSGFRLGLAATYPLAVGHARGAHGLEVIRPFADNAANYPPGSLFTNADDAGKLLTALVGGSAPAGFGAAITTALAMAPAPVPGQDFGYARGVIVRQWHGDTVLYNAGTRLGYGSFLILLPSRHAAVMVMGNRTGATLEAVAERALSHYVAFPGAGAAPSLLPVPDDEARALAGTYRNAEDLTVEISVKSGRLVATYQGRDLPVTKDASGAYHAAGPLDSFHVTRGAEGRDVYLVAQLRALRRIK